MDFGNVGIGRVQLLQAQLFPTCTLTQATLSGKGFLGNFLSKGLKTNQLEVNTDEKTLRAIARLKEPRDLFALPKDKEYDCPQQAPRWPIECQVIEERITHIVSVPDEPEPYNPTTGDELKPRPVGEENGVVVFNYNPISAVNYDKPKKKSKRHSSSDSDISSSESRGSSPERNTPDRHKLKKRGSFAKLLASMHRRSSSNSNDEFDYFDDDDDDITSNMSLSKNKRDNAKKNDLDNVWANKSPEYSPATPTFIKSQFGKDLSKTRREIANMAKSVSPVRLVQKSPPARPSVPALDLSLSALSRCSSSSSLTSDVDELNNGDDDDGSKTLRETVTKTKGDKTPQSKQQENSKSSSPDKQYFGKFLEELTGPRLIARTPRTSITSETPTQETLNNPDAKNRDKESDRDKSTEYTSFDSFEPQFSRSSVGGSKILANCHPTNPDYDGLVFESRFESGNLAKAVMITETYYELYLRSDLYTSRSKQWFYFRVKNTKKHLTYRFSIVNLVKSDSLYNEGMRPLMYSEINAKQKQWGWRRCGTNICYFRNDDENSTDDDEDNCSYTLTFNIEFPNDKDTVYFAHSYPYTYSDLQDYLMAIQKDPLKSKFCKLRLLCRSLAGNNVYYLTVTSPTNDEEILKKKKAIIVSARVHPSETPSSWMMKGLMDFITSDTAVAKRLRHRFIFKVIPMLNPDGVIVGNTRNSLTGKDLNRQYRTVIRETYPSIWYTKAMIKRLIDECNVALYCDMHAHSRKHNIFVYGCENKRNPEKKLTEQVFPLMLHKNVSEKFSFESCKFKIQRSKEGTGRIVVWMLGITNSYTIEASFGGSSLGSRKGTHFNTADYEHMGRAFCETLLDYGDESPVKERLRLKIIQRLLREGSSADEPLNIPLTDYSSDEGGIGSNSDNDGRATFSASDFEGPCCAPLTAPPTTPENISDNRRLKYKRMRKIMTELDRIYFQPLFQKKFRFFMRSRRLKQKRSSGKDRKKSKTIESNLTIAKRSAGGAEARSDDNSTESPENSTDKETPQLANPVIPSVLTDPQKFEEINEAFVKNSQHRARRKKKNKTDSGGNEGQRIKVSRMMRLWLSERNIHITRHKKNKKLKPRHKTTLIRKKSDPSRIALDLPTTDPGSDLIFSTDDEYYLQSSDSEFVPMRLNSTVPRTRRFLMQSDLQRRYIEEIGDGSELFKIPSQTSISPKIQKNVITYRPAPPPPCPPLSKHISSKLGEFPSFEFETGRRTTSWHNLHNKNLSKNRIQNPYNSLNPQTSPATEHPLSTTKKIWVGHHTPLATGGETSNRPLSWTTPPVIGPQPDRERAPKKLEGCESLLNACSQKLRTWQQQESAKASATLTPKKQLSTYKFNFIIPEMTEEERTLRIFRQVGLTKQEQIAPTKQQIKELKGKRRKNTLTNLAETTRFISCRLTKSKTRSSLQLAPQQVSKSNSVNVSNVPSSNKLTLQVSRNSKFKTGGLVATAIQNAKKSKSKLRISTKTSSQVMVLGVNTKSAAIINSPESAINSKCPSGKNMTASKPKARKSTTKSSSGITLVGRVKATLKKKSSLMIAASHTKAGQGNAKASKAAAMIGPSTSNIADTRGDGGDDGDGCSGSAILGRGLHKKASYHVLN